MCMYSGKEDFYNRIVLRVGVFFFLILTLISEQNFLIKLHLEELILRDTQWHNLLCWHAGQNVFLLFLVKMWLMPWFLMCNLK